MEVTIEITLCLIVSFTLMITNSDVNEYAHKASDK